MANNMVLMGILGPKMEKLTGNWRKFPNDDCHALYFSRNFLFSGGKIKEDDMGGHVARNGREGKCTQVFGGET
jgi:hypothetical protein